MLFFQGGGLILITCMLKCIFGGDLTCSDCLYETSCSILFVLWHKLACAFIGICMSLKLIRKTTVICVKF